MNITNELKKAIANYQQAKQAEKDIKAEVNEAKDLVVREMLSTFEKEGYAQDATLYVDGASFAYKATERSVVDPSQFLTLYEEGKISREVFIDCITIGKEKAEAALGKATVEPYISVKAGEKADLRVGKADKKSALAVGVHIEGTKTKAETQFDRRRILLKVAK